MHLFRDTLTFLVSGCSSCETREQLILETSPCAEEGTDPELGQAQVREDPSALWLSGVCWVAPGPHWFHSKGVWCRIKLQQIDVFVLAAVHTSELGEAHINPGDGFSY